MAVARTSFSFPEAAMGALRAIKSRSYLDNDADVIRAALHAYDDILSIDEDGFQIVVVDKDGVEWPYSPYSKFDYPGLRERRPANETGEVAPANFFFAGEVVERIKSIRERSFVNTHADVIRVALSAYDELISIIAAGDKILVRGKGAEGYYSPYRPWRRGALQRAA